MYEFMSCEEIPTERFDIEILYDIHTYLIPTLATCTLWIAKEKEKR